MTNRNRLRIVGRAVACTAIAGLAALGGRALADTPAANQQPKAAQAGAAAQAVEDIALAAQLAAYGQRNKDALSLILAAKIVKATPTQAMDAKPAMKGPEGAKDNGKKAGHSLDAAALLAQAAALSGDDATLKTLATRVGEESSRGATGGPRYGAYRLPGLCKNAFDVTFRGAETAEVTVQGDGSTDLDLFIYDENGNLIGADTRAGGFAGLIWCPKWTGNFRIEVCNLGADTNVYEVWTN